MLKKLKIPVVVAIGSILIVLGFQNCELPGGSSGASPAAAGTPVAVPGITYSPTSGPVGTIVTVTSTGGFDLTTVSAGSVGSAAALILNATSTSMQLFVMPGATTGTIQVTTPSGTFSATNPFTVTSSAAILANSDFAETASKIRGAGGTVGSIPQFQGISVAMSADGQTMAFGGQGDNDLEGAVWVFTRSSSNAWQQQAIIKPVSPVSPKPALGQSIALSADGNTLLAGAQAEDFSNGAVFVYKRTGVTWSFVQKLSPSGKTLPDAGYFGTAVTVSADGKSAIITAPAESYISTFPNSGFFYYFKEVSGTWTQIQRLDATNGLAFAGEQFGTRAALSANGKVLVIGSPLGNFFTPTHPNAQGIATVYLLNSAGTAWTKDQTLSPLMVNLLSLGSVQSVKSLGQGVAVNADGSTIAISAPTEGSYGAGAIWVYRNSSVESFNWTLEQKLASPVVENPRDMLLGQSISLSADGNVLLAGIAGKQVFLPTDDLEGAVRIYKRSGTTWSQDGVDIMGSLNTGSSSMGEAVALSADGKTGIFGARRDDSNAGAVWIVNP